MELQYYRVCRVRCKLCGTVLEWRNQSKDDRGPRRALSCKCGTVGLDPSACLYRILVQTTFDDMEDLSEKWEDDNV